jgi:putative flippase GtrA
MYTPQNGFQMFAKYTMVGSIGLILDMTALYIFVEYAHIPVVLAAAMAFLIAVVNNFFWHKYWTFKDKSHHSKRQFLCFFIISLSNMGITVLGMHLFVNVLFIWYMFAKVITATIVLLWSYTANRIFTFHAKKSKK